MPLEQHASFDKQQPQQESKAAAPDLHPRVFHEGAKVTVAGMQKAEQQHESRQPAEHSAGAGSKLTEVSENSRKEIAKKSEEFASAGVLPRLHLGGEAHTQSQHSQQSITDGRQSLAGTPEKHDSQNRVKDLPSQPGMLQHPAVEQPQQPGKEHSPVKELPPLPPSVRQHPTIEQPHQPGKEHSPVKELPPLPPSVLQHPEQSLPGAPVQHGDQAQHRSHQADQPHHSSDQPHHSSDQPHHSSDQPHHSSDQPHHSSDQHHHPKEHHHHIPAHHPHHPHHHHHNHHHHAAHHHGAHHHRDQHQKGDAQGKKFEDGAYDGIKAPDEATLAKSVKTVADEAKKMGLSKDATTAAVAAMLVESKGDPNARGDHGTSFGLFQLHSHGGELTQVLRDGKLKSADEAFDPVKNADVALARFKALESKYGDPGKLAAEAQRPKYQGQYAAKVDQLAKQAEELIKKYGG